MSIQSCLGLLVATAACSSAPSGLPKQGERVQEATLVPKDDAAMTQQSADAQIASDCAPAISAALAVVQARDPKETTHASAFEIVEEGGEGIDLNQDGVIDCGVRYRGRDNMLFVTKPSTYEYVGTVIADDFFGFGCSGSVHHGLCDILASERMVHGETQIRSYEYDGHRYVQKSVRLTEPHPKFGP